MQDFLQHLHDKEDFTQAVGDAIRDRAMSQLDNMKKDMAADFLQQQYKGTEDDS